MESILHKILVKLSVKVIASAVQATPSTAVNEAWPGNPLGIS